MPDIQKCNGYKEIYMQYNQGNMGGGYQQNLICNIRNKCWRHKSPDSQYQSYGPPAPDFKPESGCSNFMEVRK